MGFFDLFKNNNNEQKSSDESINQNNLENILSEFNYNISNVPNKPEIQEFILFWNHPELFQPSKVDPTVRDLVLAINTELDMNEIQDSILDTYFYALGVQLFQLTTSNKIHSSNLFISKKLFQWAIAINNKYYQAYNRLGDCYMAIEDRHKTAIACFKNSLKYLGSGGKNDLGIFKGGRARDDIFKGDNYLKIGLSLLEINRKNDAKLFILKAKEILSDEELRNGSNINYSSWNEVLEFLENYNAEEYSKIKANAKQQQQQQQQIIQGKINQAIELKRNGDFNGANSIYIDLDTTYPNNPTIIKGWAKVLVCKQEYDKAIEKYTISSKLYKDIGNPEHYQCDEQANKIKTRFENPDSFKTWVYAVSGCSIAIENVEL